jgi:hypothetical protein
VTRRGSAGRLASATVALALTLGGLSGCGFNFVGSKKVPEIAATVEGIDIPSSTVEELVRNYRATEAGKEQDPTTDTVLVSDKIVRQTALSYQIKITFLEALAKKEGIDIEKADEDIFGDIRDAPSMAGSGVRPEDLEIAARAEKLQKAIARKILSDVPVSESELKEAFDERAEALGESFSAVTDIAFMNTEEDANKLREETKNGKDFIETAKSLDELRVDTATFTPLSPVSGDFIDKVRALKEGEVSDILKFEVDDGPLFVVLHVSKRKDLKALTVDEVKDELTVIVQDKKRFQFFEQWFDKRFREADIDVDGYYGSWTPKSLAVT